MNILHMKYAAEVAKEGSLSKAAQNLLIFLCEYSYR